MFDKKLANKIDEFIKEKFPILYEYDFDGIIMVYGGVIKNLLMGEPVKDLDIAILSQNECQIGDFIKKYKLRFYKNMCGGYKILYNDFTVDFCTVSDYIEIIQFDIDALCYDVRGHEFICIGAMGAIEANLFSLVVAGNFHLHPGRRVNKLKKFVSFVNKKQGRVGVKYNKFMWNMLKLKRRIVVRWYKYFDGNFQKCFKFLNNAKKETNLLIILSILLIFGSFLVPMMSGNLVSSILDKNFKLIGIYILVVALLKVLTLILSYGISKINLKLKKKMLFNIRKGIIEHVMNVNINTYNEKNSGVFIDRLVSDSARIVNSFDLIKEHIVKLIENIFVIAYIFYLDYRIGFLLLLFICLILKTEFKGIQKRFGFKQEYFLNQERFTGVLGEMIHGMNDIKALDLKDNYIKNTDELCNTLGNNEYAGDNYWNLYNKIARALRYVAIGVILLVGILLINYKLLTTSVLIIIFMYHSSMFAFLDKVAALLGSFYNLNVSCNRVFALFDNNVYVKEVFGDKYNSNCKGKIEFNNLNFRYNNNSKYVLNGCSFIVNPNETVAIIGKSGNGKTTILNLIARLYNVENGTLKIDDIDINEYSEEFIREHVAIVSQNSYLFNMSIRDNFKLINEDITDKEIKKNCMLTCLDDFVESLPKKYDTVIGEGGVKLSGGQRQRLAIARALAKKSKIILLDEITSALDNETSSLIKKTINNIQKNHTIIIVTHELSMIKDCSRILVLEDGKIIGDGKHSSLVRTNEVYKKLYKMK